VRAILADIVLERAPMSELRNSERRAAPRQRFSLRDLDLVTAGAFVGAVVTAYILWWSRDRTSILGLEPDRAHETAADRDAIILGVLFVLLGFCIALLMKRFAGVQGDLPFVLIVFLPMVIFLILSGKITNLTAGPTGLALTVSLSQSTLPPVTDTSVGRGIAIAGTPPSEAPVCEEPQEFTNQAPYLPPEGDAQLPVATVRGAPVYLKLIMGRCQYTMQQVADILTRNTYNDEFRFIVLVDRSDRFRAYMDSLTATELFSCAEYAYEGGPCDSWAYPTLIDAINDDSFAIQNFPGIVSTTIPADATNIAALKEMKRRGLDALVVTNRDGSIKGVLSQEVILSTMMIELASPTP
jgi:hypothetical protein